MAIDNHHLINGVAPVADVVNPIAMIQPKPLHLLARISKVAVVVGFAGIIYLLLHLKECCKKAPIWFQPRPQLLKTKANQRRW